MALHTFSIPSLRGRRARLRAPRADDAGRLSALYADPTGHLEECAEFFARGDRIDWIVADAADVAIGTCTLYAIDRRRHCAEIGYALRSDVRGRGLATDAVAQVIAWSLRNFKLQRIEACVAHDNLPSQRLLERLGFAEVGSEPDGIARWALDAVPSDHSRRLASSR
jgi:RimJ/RimL family protein N-acetyltransferase